MENHVGGQAAPPPDNEVRHELEGIAAALQEELRANDAAELTYRRADYTATLQHSVNALNLRMQILRLKYDYYARRMDQGQIFVIAVSTVLTIVETLKAELGWGDASKTDAATFTAMRLLPVMLSALVALVATVLKFLKLQERMEFIGRAVERAITTISRLKRSQDACAAAVTLEEVDAMIQKYPELNEQVHETLLVIELSLKFREFVRHLPTYHHLMLTHIQSEAGFRRDMARAGHSDGAGGEGRAVRPARRGGV